jgi:hydrogenase nickel incorporation protein HypB
MCETCGCGSKDDAYKIYKPGEEIAEPAIASAHYHENHNHVHSDHEHSHTHTNHEHTHNFHEHTDEHQNISSKQVIEIGKDILETNNLIAERNRGYFEAKAILALNLVSSPGSGKTSLLEKTIVGLRDYRKCAVIEGDQQTDNDARRIAVTGADVLQINTGNACHLDANMIHDTLHQLKPADDSVVFIENVGNLVCPALFDLGEKFRVVIFSVTEGEDKPLKYPNMFHTSQVCIINKIDLLPYLDFDLELAKQNVLKVNPNLKIIEVSVKNGKGMSEWINWVKQN